jgi:ribosomal protein L37E
MRTGEVIIDGGRRFEIDRWNGRDYYVCDICGRNSFISLIDAHTCCGAPRKVKHKVKQLFSVMLQQG